MLQNSAYMTHAHLGVTSLAAKPKQFGVKAAVCPAGLEIGSGEDGKYSQVYEDQAGQICVSIYLYYFAFSQPTASASLGTILVTEMK